MGRRKKRYFVANCGEYSSPNWLIFDREEDRFIPEERYNYPTRKEAKVVEKALNN